MRGAYSETRSDRAALVKPGGPVVGCVRRDPVCGEAMPGRRMSTCSDQCRARQSRLARGPLPVSVARELRASLTMSRGTAWQRTVTRERNGSGEGGPGMVGPATRKAPLHERIPTVENARLYRDKRLSPAEIATRFGVTRHAVLSRLRADGIRQGAKAPRGRRGHEARTQDGTPGHPVLPARGRPPGRGKLLSQVSMDELAQLYHQDGFSLNDIAQQFGVTRQAVHQLLKARGIATRDGSQARILALAQQVAGKALRRRVRAFDTVTPR